MCKVLSPLVFLIAFLFGSYASAESQKLDTKLKPAPEETPSSIFEDMAVVQRKAMEKSGRFLFSSYFAVDFSDGPRTLYAPNFNPGYAISDLWEVYLNVIPFFVSFNRPIVAQVESLTLQGGQQATIVMSAPQYQVGLELQHAFGYGKDSIGLTTLARSDTFIKIGAAYIKYTTDFGLRFEAGIGKSFFLSNSTSFRVSLVSNYMQTIIDSVKTYKFLITVEAGLVFYF